MSKKSRRTPQHQPSKPPRLPSWPDGVVMFAIYFCYICAAFFGAMLAEFSPSYWKTANSVPLTEWGWAGWFVTFIMFLVSALACGYALLGEEFKRILQERD